MLKLNILIGFQISILGVRQVPGAGPAVVSCAFQKLKNLGDSCISSKLDFSVPIVQL